MKLKLLMAALAGSGLLASGHVAAQETIRFAVTDIDGLEELQRDMGPFKDALGKPLVAKAEYPCQSIDPMVFIDDDGAAYLYFGQGKCMAVKLNDDMISFDHQAAKAIQPKGYNEGSFVFKRKGVYYLSWSEFDTRDPRYSFASATSASAASSSRSTAKASPARRRRSRRARSPDRPRSCISARWCPTRGPLRE